MKGLAEKYNKELKPKLQKDLGLKNIMSVPKITKIVINIGLGKAAQNKQWVEIAQSILERISGQKPVLTKARKSISNFKIREGMVVGAKVTLHGQKMYDFLDKLVNATFPRLRDFHGIDLKKGFDKNGNYTIGFVEHIIFPEIGMDDVDKVHGLELTISTSAKDDKQTLALLRAFGFPFKKDKPAKGGVNK
ncbi:50S ribosomal protein L5 [bacterium]|jgi:large subunit ribosomal protein L5|nr:50S ribosomal protein L5 [bacterium]MBT4649518.1 50S ribosomal protein L5 [bacterium]